ncbi:hypothetical protein EKN56_05975 [Limnobaculum zhutongyuii]|uniref:Phage I-like protein n=1 Tax=Limnobaculum zhutongyuii TaxID=2498113 RepID=A0A411WIH5_9GAMM|nr:phage protease [Limnobaculum zhutongyuii]QBH95988.1 hypothetical protein EKN56_05975 [Limnobaculum zhutongyuii]TQS89301.1 hypothetical protein ELQ32_05945 [Limnobaculum zhutongyuii]
MKIRIAALTLKINQATANEIQLFPAGEFAAVDGRPHNVESGQWTLTAELASVLIEQVASSTNPFVIDYEHQTLRTVTNGQPAPAAGWYNALEWRDDGLYAINVTWTKTAATMIDNGEYRFISPTFLYNKKGEVVRLLHAALTNTPALDGMDEVMLAAASRLASLSTSPENITVDEELLANLLQSLRWTLNLPATATAEDIVAELQKIIDAVSAGQGMAATSVGLLALLTQKDEQIVALTATAYDPEKHAPIEVVNDLQAKLAAVSITSTESIVDGLVTAALSDGRLLPVQEAWAKDLGNKSVDSLKSFLDKAPKIAALTGQQSDTQTKPDVDKKNLIMTELDAEQLAICNQFGNDPAEIAKLLQGE